MTREERAHQADAELAAAVRRAIGQVAAGIERWIVAVGAHREVGERATRAVRGLERLVRELME